MEVELFYLQESDSVKAMLSFREKLPAYNVKSEFLSAVAANQVPFLYIGIFYIFQMIGIRTT